MGGALASSNSIEQNSTSDKLRKAFKAAAYIFDSAVNGAEDGMLGGFFVGICAAAPMAGGAGIVVENAVFGAAALGVSNQEFGLIVVSGTVLVIMCVCGVIGGGVGAVREYRRIVKQSKTATL